MEKEYQTHIGDNQETYLNEKEIESHETDDSLKEGFKYLIWVMGVAVIVVAFSYLYHYFK